jgi:CDGSH-type Zn-finger protein
MDGPRIEFEPNGPLIVHGPATIVDADGLEKKVEPGHSVRLCRCGHSGKKPFCDDSHRIVDFVSRPQFEPERRQVVRRAAHARDMP